MKKLFLSTLLVCICIISQAQTGIGTTSPNASAKLDVYSTNKGFLPPRMTSAQRTSIANPAAGLMVYQTDGIIGLYYYNGTSWVYVINNANNVLSVANGGTGVTNSTGTGNTVLSNNPTIESLTVSSGNTQFPSSINVSTTTHATSKRAAIWLDGWGIMQDILGNGTKNFSISQSFGGTYPTRLFISTDGNMGIRNDAPTQALDVTGVGKFSSSIINSGSRSYFGKDGSNMHWLATTDVVAEPYNLGYGVEASAGILSHRWNTAGVERMRLNTSGYLGIGTSSPSTSIHVENGNNFGTNPSSTSSPSLYIFNNNNASSTANATALIRTAGTSSGKPYLSLDISGVSGYSLGINNPTDQLIFNTTWNFITGSAGNNAITINRSGQSRVVIPSEGGAVAASWPSGWGGGLITYDFACAGVYYTTLLARSDKRLKNTIVDLDSSMVYKYLQLRPVNYYWNDESDNKHRQYGLIAQEVEEFFPDIVSIANDSMQTKSVNYQALHALSLKVIQSQQLEVEKLKKKQLDMEDRLLKLEAKLNQ